jgi:hypothetical protein
VTVAFTQQIGFSTAGSARVSQRPVTRFFVKPAVSLHSTSTAPSTKSRSASRATTHAVPAVAAMLGALFVV